VDFAPPPQDDESILYAQAEAAVAAALAVLGNGGALPAATAAAEAAAADAEAAAVAAAAAAAGGGSGVDEFGRDLGLQRRQELQRGAGRRQALVAGVLAQVASLQQGEHGVGVSTYAHVRAWWFLLS
jgi:hypothetical protein